MVEHKFTYFFRKITLKKQKSRLQAPESPFKNFLYNKSLDFADKLLPLCAEN
jgi:hypothetical protein